MDCSSIIILSLNFGSQLIEVTDDEESVFTLDGSIISVAHRLQDLFLSATFEGGLIVDPVPEVPLVQLSHAASFLFRELVEWLSGVLAEEVIAVEQPIDVEEGSPHPDGSDSSQPPGVGLHDEVGIIKHDYIIDLAPFIPAWQPATSRTKQLAVHIKHWRSHTRASEKSSLFYMLSILTFKYPI